MEDASLEMLSVLLLQRLLSRVWVIELDVCEAFGGASSSIEWDVYLSKHVSTTSAIATCMYAG